VLSLLSCFPGPISEKDGKSRVCVSGVDVEVGLREQLRITAVLVEEGGQRWSVHQVGNEGMMTGWKEKSLYQTALL
jgi:hypothetical protein